MQTYKSHLDKFATRWKIKTWYKHDMDFNLELVPDNSDWFILIKK